MLWQARGEICIRKLSLYTRVREIGKKERCVVSEGEREKQYTQISTYYIEHLNNNVKINKLQ